jgi:hypothetical protein
MRMRILATLLFISNLFAAPALGQQGAAILPTVTSFDCPKYPSIAYSNRLQGAVQLQVTTDGHGVKDVKLVSGHPMIAPDAIKNVKTWKFVDHAPTTFMVTYLFTNAGNFKRDKVTNCSAKMELPTKVTISTSF